MDGWLTGRQPEETLNRLNSAKWSWLLFCFVAALFLSLPGQQGDTPAAPPQTEQLLEPT